MAIQASKSISLTVLATSSAIKLSANQVVKFTASGSNTLLTYLTDQNEIITKLFTEDVATINTAAARTQAVTLNDAASTVIYIHSDKIIFLDAITAGTLITYWNPGLSAPEQISVSETPSDINTAAANTFAITTQPTRTNPSGTRYINNLFVGTVVGEDVGTPPEITFTTKVKTGTGAVTTAGTGYTSLVAAITGGGGSGATGTVTGKAISAVPAAAGTGYVAGTSVITLTGGTAATAAKFNVTHTELVSLAVNAAGTGMVAGTTVLTTVGNTGTAATLTVTHTKAVSATVAAGGTGDLADGAGVIVEGTTGTGTKFRASVTIATNAIASVQSITVAGDYTVNPTAIATEPVTYISGAGGGTTLTGAQLNVVMGALTVAVTTGGDLTVTSTSLTSTGGGNDATFNTALYGAKTLTVNTAGDYSVLPTNPAAQGSATGGGTGATLTVSWGILAFTITAAGTGYTSYPTFSVTGAGGTGGVITAAMTVESPLTIVDGGTNINTAPTLTFSATAGTLATATATLDAASQTVTSTTLTAAGSYLKGTDTYPSLAISGGAGAQISYDSKGTAFQKLQVEQTIGTIQTAINAL